MKDKKKIMVFIDWYVPGFKAGGPIRSVFNIVSALKEEYNFFILTSAYDLGEENPYKDIELNQWNDVDGVLIKYLDKDHIKNAVIKHNVDEIDPDLLYVNGIFSRYFSILPIRIGRTKKIKTIVAPRGMLGDGALDVKKFKKNLFLKYSKFTKMFENVTWHASTDLESAEIKKIFGEKAAIRISINIPSPQTLKMGQISKLKKYDEIKLVYVGRLSPKKNLHLLIDWIQKFSYTKKTILEIWGESSEKEYVDELHQIIKPNSKVEIQFKGAANPMELPQIYASSHYFILMTKHENYGHVIAEALSNGCPVIISDKTPWRDLQTKGIGWDIDIDENQFLKTLDKAIKMDPIDYNKMAQNAFNYFKEHVYGPEVIASNKQLFEDEGN
ncbi:MAG: glycosyltransferase [Crocinitomicaceae bacterium]|nr:glycosyltransferase [Crocinitomicaceae bacterium]